jgi:tetratricopeptide (TPR) repeat protein
VEARGGYGAAGLPIRVGRFEVLALLGQGGFGSVYKARDPELDRVVAIKVPRPGAFGSSGDAERFLREARSAARLRHPGIVPVHEIGHERGLPYIVADFIDGTTLNDHMAHGPLGFRESALLVAQLAEALDFAHRHQVIHRDIKPGNVLLDRTGRPHLTDFGLARRNDEREITLTMDGQIVGTPAYMAPEQAAGDLARVDSRSDVYSLGVVLYELLTGGLPFRGTMRMLLHQVQHEEPRPPRRLNDRIPRDLETITLKAMAKEPAERYQTAGEVAADLRRWLAGEPIQARPIGALGRAVKWARRRPTVAVLLGALLVALSVLVAVWVSSYVQLSRSARELKQSNDNALGVVEDMYTKVAEEWLADEPQKDPLQREFLEKALRFYEDRAGRGDTDPDARRRTALAGFRVGQLHRTLNEPDKAAVDYGKAIKLQEQLRDQFPGERGYRQDLANSYNWLGELLRDSGGSMKEAEENYRRALALQERLVEEDAQEPAGHRQPAYRRELARSHSNLGLVEMDTDRGEAALKDYDRAVELLEQLVAESPSSDSSNDFRHELARTRTNRGSFHRTHKRLAEAEADYRRAIELLRDMRGSGRRRAVYEFNLAIAYQNLGNVFWDRQEHAKALTELGHAQTILARLVENFPDRPHYKKKLAKTCNSRGSALAESRQWRAAEENWSEARRLFGELGEHDQQTAEYQADLGRCVGNLGWLRSQQGDPRAARPYLEEAIDRLGKARAMSPGRLDYREDLREQYQTLAEILVVVGDTAAAVEAAAALADIFPERALGHYYAACFIARCVPLAERKGESGAAARYADQAETFLRQALDKGLTGGERLAKAQEPFGPLAQRTDWADLLKKLEARPRPAVVKVAP